MSKCLITSVRWAFSCCKLPQKLPATRDCSKFFTSPISERSFSTRGELASSAIVFGFGLASAAPLRWLPLSDLGVTGVSSEPSPTNLASLAGIRCEDSKKAGLKLSPELMLAEEGEILGNSTRLKPALLLGSAVAKVLGFGILRAALNLAGWAKLGAISTSGSRSRGRPPEPDPPEESLAKSWGVMATISTPLTVSLVDKIMASAPISRRTFFKASAVFEAVNFWGPICTPLYRDFSWFGLPDYILLGKSSDSRWGGVRPVPGRWLAGKPVWQSWQRSCGCGCHSQSLAVNYWLPFLARL